MSDRLESFTADVFTSRLHERFGLDVDGREQFDLQLIEVTELGSTTPGRRTQFSLVFRGPPQPLLPQRIYRLEHPELGAFELFLVPIAPATYEAVFT
jgi:hypothetical protein